MESKPYRWQSDCLERWIQQGCMGIAHVVTGAGKTRLALMAVDYLHSHSPFPLHTLIVVPTVSLMEQWVRELKNTFGGSCRISRVGGGFCGASDAAFQVMVVNSARALLPSRRNALLAKDNSVFLICDECHHYGSAENRRIFSGLPLQASRYYTLGLSATPHSAWFQTVLKPALGPVIYSYGHDAARRDQIIAHFILEQVAIRFNGIEMQQYAQLSYEISIGLKKLLQRSTAISDLPPGEFFLHLHRMKDSGDEDAENLLNLLLRRKELVLLADSRIQCARRLIEQLPAYRRILVFCERICQADAVYSALESRYRCQMGKYHSHRTAEQNRSDMQRFKDGEVRILIACKSLDEGIDVPEADVAIVLSGTAMERQHIQRLGRILRRDGNTNKVGILYYLYVKQSSEESSFLPGSSGEAETVNLQYSVQDDFSCTEYEDLAITVLDTLQRRSADEKQLCEAKDRILSGLTLPDWKRPPEYCREQAQIAAAHGDQRTENYWRCMSWMSKEARSQQDNDPA